MGEVPPGLFELHSVLSLAYTQVSTKKDARRLRFSCEWAGVFSFFFYCVSDPHAELAGAFMCHGVSLSNVKYVPPHAGLTVTVTPMFVQLGTEKTL